ncbi:MAG: response regulator [Nitrospirae bacterium]|nr:response regulator [Nitrospirota bacterium]
MEGRILVADDDTSIRMALSEALEDEGYEVIAVGSGKQALQEILSKDLDLILLDIKMPDMPGTEVLKKLRAKSKTLPVIMLTAFSGMEKDVEIQLGKISAFISKPFDIEDVLNTVSRILEENAQDGTKDE